MVNGRDVRRKLVSSEGQNVVKTKVEMLTAIFFFLFLSPLVGFLFLTVTKAPCYLRC